MVCTDVLFCRCMCDFDPGTHTIIFIQFLSLKLDVTRVLALRPGKVFGILWNGHLPKLILMRWDIYRERRVALRKRPVSAVGLIPEAATWATIAEAEGLRDSQHRRAIEVMRDCPKPMPLSRHWANFGKQNHEGVRLKGHHAHACFEHDEWDMLYPMFVESGMIVDGYFYL